MSDTTPDTSYRQENHSNSSQNHLRGSTEAAGPVNYLADSTPTTAKRQITYCLVCGAESSGFHYGVLSCEGCKVFFRRCRERLPAKPSKCSEQNNCNIDLISRRKCRKCRFDRCISVGMVLEGPKGKRRPKHSNQDQSSQAAEENPLSVDEYLILQNIIKIHKERCPFQKQAPSFVSSHL